MHGGQPDNNSKHMPMREKSHASGEGKISHFYRTKRLTPDSYLRSMKNMLGRMEEVLSRLSLTNIEEDKNNGGKP